MSNDAVSGFKKLFNEFFNSEKIGGLILLIATVVSLMIANSTVGDQYLNFWNNEKFHTAHWINDGLMTLFFLLIGLELEREIYTGELSTLKKASLPIFGALGGMLFPAAIYLWFNSETSLRSGFGIPMATDIAFAIGIISLIGNKVSKSLKVFLTAFAVIDDLGAIILIAVFYSASINIVNLSVALGIFGLLILLNKLKFHALSLYLGGGILMWFFMLNSGVHPTITGVMLAFAIPFGNGTEKSPSYILQHFLHKPVALIILPLFALANTAIMINSSIGEFFTQTHFIGIVLGLLLGKPLGIWLFSITGVKLKLCELPARLRWKDIFGVSILGGIGFTMSIFIALRAFENPQIIDSSKIAILISSLLAGILGLIFLKIILKRTVEDDQ